MPIFEYWVSDGSYQTVPSKNHFEKSKITLYQSSENVVVYE